MIVIDQFFNDAVLAKADQRIKDPGRGWTNLSWNPRLRDNSALIWITVFPEIKLDVIEPFLRAGMHIQSLDRLSVQFCIWYRGSSINWHNDYKYMWASTIYLNSHWRTEDGGLFMFQDQNSAEYEVVVPRRNRCVINDGHEHHHVTQISMNAQTPRYTIQVWHHGNNVLKNSQYI